MTEEQTKGVCFFCYNNNQLDYVKFAHISAAFAKKNMNGINTCLITDQGTLEWLETSIDKEFHENCFDDIVITDISNAPSNPRKHFDGPWSEFSAQFNNSNKHEIFYLSPYDKTILMDTDYIVMNDFYNYLFESDISIAMHRLARYTEHQSPYLNEQDLNEAGVHHWWSTFVYFDKSYESKLFFDTWAHVKENWDYYHMLYQFPPALFRTDFCVSVAVHMLNGYNENPFVHDFMGIPLVNMDQKDDIIEINSVDDWVLLSHNRKEPWKQILSRNYQINLHAMNKQALSRNADKIIELLKNE